MRGEKRAGTDSARGPLHCWAGRKSLVCPLQHLPPRVRLARDPYPRRLATVRFLSARPSRAGRQRAVAVLESECCRHRAHRSFKHHLPGRWHCQGGHSTSRLLPASSTAVSGVALNPAGMGGHRALPQGLPARSGCRGRSDDERSGTLSEARVRPLAGRTGPVARPLARHEPSTGLLVFGARRAASPCAPGHAAEPGLAARPQRRVQDDDLHPV